MNIVTNLTIDLLAFANQLNPETTPREVGRLLGLFNTTAMASARSTPRRIIEMIEGAVPREAVLETLAGFAEGAGEGPGNRPWLHLVVGCAWEVLGSSQFFNTTGNLANLRMEMGKEGHPERWLVITQEPQPPRCWRSTTVSEWTPEPGWTYPGDPLCGGTQAAFLSTTTDGNFKAPSVLAFLMKTSGKM